MTIIPCVANARLAQELCNEQVTMDKSPSKQRVKSRQSLAHISSRSNTTTDIAALRRDEENKAKTKCTRGKSLGPGGLEALTETSGNAFRV